jgi:basic endochitinase B
MSCTVGKPYIVKAGDTLFIIAEQLLGDGNRWREIKKPDGTPVTDADAPNLQVGQELCISNGSVPPSPPPSNGFASIVSQQTYESMFPNRSSLYAYDSLVTATQKFPSFCNEGSDEQRKQEAAAFLANIAHETTGGWDEAPDGPYAWGLYFIEDEQPQEHTVIHPALPILVYEANPITVAVRSSLRGTTTTVKRVKL